jgi:hydrogenase expression/formation protein HypC
MCLAIPGQIVEIVDEERSTARVDVAGVAREVNIALLTWGGARLEPGDWVLIHVGFALSRIDEAEAERTLALLREMGDAFDAELAELAAEGRTA